MNSKITFAVLAAFTIVGCAKDPDRDIKSANEAKAEEHSEYRTNNAELKAEHREEAVKKDEKVLEARTEMTEQRKELAARVDGRLAKVDAKAASARAKTRNVTGPKRVALDSDWTTFDAQRSTLVQKSKTIASAPDAAWAETKREVEKSLDDLEARVDLLSSKF